MTTPGEVVGATGVLVGAAAVGVVASVVGELPPRSVVPDTNVDAGGTLVIVVTPVLAV